MNKVNYRAADALEYHIPGGNKYGDGRQKGNVLGLLLGILRAVEQGSLGRMKSLTRPIKNSSTPPNIRTLS